MMRVPQTLSRRVVGNVRPNIAVASRCFSSSNSAAAAAQDPTASQEKATASASNAAKFGIGSISAGLLGLFGLQRAGVLSETNSFDHYGEGIKFLENKSQESDVIKLRSGLMYKVLRSGEGKFHPTANSPCACHYKGELIPAAGSKQFDSSYDRGQPTTFAPNQVIKGWTEAMQLMVEGDKWEMYIPPELAYGDYGAGSAIPGGSTLVFTMEIVNIRGAKIAKA